MRCLPAGCATAPEVGFVHRKLPFADIYFLANTSNHPVQAKAEFRVEGLDASIVGPVHRQGDFGLDGKRIDLIPGAIRIARAGVFEGSWASAPT